MESLEEPFMGLVARDDDRSSYESHSCRIRKRGLKDIPTSTSTILLPSKLSVSTSNSEFAESAYSSSDSDMPPPLDIYFSEVLAANAEVGQQTPQQRHPTELPSSLLDHLSSGRFSVSAQSAKIINKLQTVLASLVLRLKWHSNGKIDRQADSSISATSVPYTMFAEILSFLTDRNNLQSFLTFLQTPCRSKWVFCAIAGLSVFFCIVTYRPRYEPVQEALPPHLWRKLRTIYA